MSNLEKGIYVLKPKRKQGDIIGAYCPSCELESCFTFIGEQEIESLLNLYNCDNCHSTLSEGTIREYTRKRLGKLK